MQRYNLFSIPPKFLERKKDISPAISIQHSVLPWKTLNQKQRFQGKTGI